MTSPDSLYPWISSYPETPRWDTVFAPAVITTALDKTVQSTPDAPAFDFMGKKLSWQELCDQVNHFSAGLQALGVGKGVHVGLFLPNCPLYLIAYYAVLKTGGTVVNFNPLYAVSEIEHQINDSQTQIMVTLDLEILCRSVIPMLQKTGLQKMIVGRFDTFLPFPKNIFFNLFKRADKARIPRNQNILRFEHVIKNDGIVQPVQIDVQNDIAVLQYTGGTTGTPKGAMLTHANITVNAAQCYSHFPRSPTPEIMLAVLPFFHVFSMTVSLNMAVLAGMQIVTQPRFDLKQTLKLIARKKPHYMPAVPAIFNAINHDPDLARYDLSSLRFCISGGAPLPVEVKKAFEKKTGCVVMEGYGLTESSPVATVNPPMGENVAGSIGLPLPQTIIEIIDPSDKHTPCKLGERGELCIRGPQVMKGYWNNPSATADVLRVTPEGDRRLHTGDVAIMDARGYIYIVDRIKDMIITNGYNVYPRNVEDAIYQHPAVEECIVAGLPDEQRGEIVKAWIKLRKDIVLTEKELKDFLAEKLSKIEMPRQIVFRTTPLPKTMIGKLSRKDMIALDQEGL